MMSLYVWECLRSGVWVAFAVVYTGDGWMKIDFDGF